MSDHHHQPKAQEASASSPITGVSHLQKRPKPATSSGPAPSSSFATPTTPTSLATFLHRDIQPDGHRLLLPFLTTTDRLHLSVCSKGLLNYRYHLTKVKVVNPYPSAFPTPGSKKGLTRLLYHQRGLEYLYVAHTSALCVLELASWGWFDKLKTLDLCGISDYMLEALEEYPHDSYHDKAKELHELYVGHMARAFQGGGLEGLEELVMSGYMICGDTYLGRPAAMAIMRALKAGECPQLRRLYLSKMCDDYVGQDFLHAMAGALESGHLQHLEVLDVSEATYFQNGWGTAMARALQGGACPQLVCLYLSDSSLSREDGQALGEALRSGSCAKLEELDLGGSENYVFEGFTAIFEALEAGGCPSLRRLDGKNVWMPMESAAALGHALRSRHCQQLQWLDLDGAFEDRQASLCVLQAIQRWGRGGALLPNLFDLDLSYIHMDQEHGRVLGEAIGKGALPQLEDLNLSRNEGLVDGGLVPIMVGLEGGGCRHLNVLHLREVGMGPQGGHALARALASGHLNFLTVLDMCKIGDVGDEAMAEVIKGLRECHRLWSLYANSTGMGVMAGQALVQALQDKAWPRIGKLYASDNNQYLCDEGVVVGLVGVLERRADLCPRLKGVKFEKSGLDEEGEVGSRLARLLQ